MTLKVLVLYTHCNNMNRDKLEGNQEVVYGTTLELRVYMTCGENELFNLLHFTFSDLYL